MIVQPITRHDTPLPTQQQLGKYQWVATLGQGGMGTVYLALASGFGEFRKLLVVKELRHELTLQKGFVSMFMDEAKLAARLSHPNVVQTFEASVSGDRYFIAMEYLDGQSLSALLDRLSRSPGSKLSLWMHLQILCEALSGLHYAHQLLDYGGSSLQVVHRDVSPQNVFVTYHGQVKVVDFGVAKVANASARTAPGVFVGKFNYAAPEQVLGGPVDARTDVFAMGVMLWQAIAGQPFSEQVPTSAACRARCQGLEPRIAEVVPTIDPALAQICDRALAVDPEGRFASALELRAELQDYLQREGVRVEASEIGQLMCEVFEAERRALHARIELAMRNNGVGASNVDELSIFHSADKVPTAVADLSSLVDVSLERDDQKIREAYTHSKITRVRSASEQERTMELPTIVHRPRGRLWALSALAIGALAGVSIAVFGHARPRAAATETRAQSLASAASAPVAIQLSAPPRAALPDSAAHEGGALGPEANAVVSLARAKPASSPLTAATPSRARTRATPTAPAVTARDLPEPVHATQPEPAATRRSLEAGADLVFDRRAPSVRIDRENPYR